MAKARRKENRKAIGRDRVAQAVFAAADAAGHVTVWNIAVSVDAPIATVELFDSAEGGGGASSNTRNLSLTTLQWNHTGEYIVVGGSQGEVFLLAVSSAVAAPTIQHMERFNEWMNRTFAA